ncbi:MAG: DUF2934 domain-containing protein [Limisphaerales bacterium]
MAKEITQPTDEQIRTRAYYLWEADGCQPGRDWEYWIKAKQEFEAQDQPVAAAPTTSTSSKRASNGSSTTSSTKRRSSSRSAVYA